MSVKLINVLLVLCSDNFFILIGSFSVAEFSAHCSRIQSSVSSKNLV